MLEIKDPIKTTKFECWISDQSNWEGKRLYGHMFEMVDTAFIVIEEHRSLILVKVKSYFSDFCGEIWCEYSKYFMRNQWKFSGRRGNFVWKLEKVVTTLNC